MTVLKGLSLHVAYESLDNDISFESIELLAFAHGPEEILCELLYDFIEDEAGILCGPEGVFL